MVIGRDDSRARPSQAKRRRPDFAFHPQIYRADGESLRLPKGTYTVECSRGPEYFPERRTITVGAEPAAVEIALCRWIDPSTLVGQVYQGQVYTSLLVSGDWRLIQFDTRREWVWAGYTDDVGLN